MTRPDHTIIADYGGRVSDSGRIELTIRLWGTGAPDAFEEYIDHLRDMLPRHRGCFERRVEPIDGQASAPDAVIVLSFPDSPSIDGFLRDPQRGDAEDLALRAVSRSLITDGRRRGAPAGGFAAQVVNLHDDA